MDIKHALQHVRTGLFIDGQWVSAPGERMATYDPASGAELVQVSVATEPQIDAAVSAAQRALKGEWWRMKPSARARILLRTAALIRKNNDHLACIESLDCGKPLREAAVDIETTARYFEYYGGIADKLEGESIPLGVDYMAFTLHDPVGVTAHIVPWNYPLATTARGLAPALACGCTALVKPAEQTPLTALLLADLLAEAGLPNGVYNVVSGPGESVGAALVGHPGVDHITFTGSVATGKKVMRSAASHVTSVILELGGKSPVVVLSDADIDDALAGTLKAIYQNAGQTCSAGSRLVIERGVRDQFLERFVSASKALKLGRGIDNPDLGPLVSPDQLSRVCRYVDDAKVQGLEILSGGKPVTVEGLAGGWFYAPTVIDGTHTDDVVVQEEIFGPVLAVQTADDVDQAIALANCTNFGLVAGVYTRDLRKALRCARDIEAGQIFINEYFAGGVETPFGGTKASGFGREKGLAALRNYCRVKTITARI